MQIDRRGREVIHWDLTEPPAGTLEVTLDGNTWHTLTRDGDTASLLVAGPDAEGTGGVVLKMGRSFALMRAAADPEVLVREAGVIDVVTLLPPSAP
ncbi:hypothetical protein [Isoptericola sp. NPDC055881]